jgi:mannose-6-phosphate isomerase-like protein (cupin superfamily)
MEPDSTPNDLKPQLPDGWLMAPDGIPVRPLTLESGGLIGLAEGLIAPGDFDVHLHYSIEQVTYVLSGQVRVRMASPNETVVLGPGQAVLTQPGRTLSFHNDGSEAARVLFICAPPYPPDDSDTGRPPNHGPLSSSDLVRSAERRRLALGEIQALFSSRDRNFGG